MNVQEDRILRFPDVVKIVGMSSASLKREMNAGRFPRPFKILTHGRSVGWRYSTVLRWIEERSDAGEQLAA